MSVVIKKYFMTKLLKKSTNYGILNIYLGNFTLKEFQYNKLTYIVIASFLL